MVLGNVNNPLQDPLEMSNFLWKDWTASTKSHEFILPCPLKMESNQCHGKPSINNNINVALLLQNGAISLGVVILLFCHCHLNFTSHCSVCVSILPSKHLITERSSESLEFASTSVWNLQRGNTNGIGVAWEGWMSWIAAFVTREFFCESGTLSNCGKCSDLRRELGYLLW